MNIINELTTYIREQDERLLALEKRVAELEGNNRVTVKMEDIAPVKVTKPDVFKAAQEVEKTGDIFAEEKPKRTRNDFNGRHHWKKEELSDIATYAAAGFTDEAIAEMFGNREGGFTVSAEAIKRQMYTIRKAATL